jgi:hypothetical protein
MTDFSKTNIHCSSISAIMSNGKGGKSNKEKWETAKDKLYSWQSKYYALDDKKQSQAVGKNMMAKIEKYTQEVADLDKIKDIEMLSDGAKSHLKKVYGYAKYGKWCAASDKGTKYTNKGNLAEVESINLVSRLQGMNYIKNEERISNGYLTGIPDIFVGESIYKAKYIIDVKTSWDIETFLDNLGKPLNSAYWWQIQGYLAITGAELGEVSYCLVDTPQSLINTERYKLLDRLNVLTEDDPLYIEKEKELINNLTFGDMPEKERRLRFLVERDDDAINKIYSKVELCRQYLSEIEEMHLIGEFLAKEPVQEEEKEQSEE